MPRVDSNDLAGVAELAHEHGVTPQAISNWIKRHPTFPRPVRVLSMGPIYSAAAVRRWVAKRAKVISS